MNDASLSSEYEARISRKKNILTTSHRTNICVSHSKLTAPFPVKNLKNTAPSPDQ